ncbi:MAG: WD40 repeat domain-containing protein, partial [Coleofasciculus sp. S288]|nr:WD40 repeat domain-containing protein [Coleofasciculus sp. S288]
KGDVRTWQFEQEKSLQQQLAAYNRETQLSIATYQRETALQLPESHKILENWPLRLFPSQLLGSHPIARPIPLRIFLSPLQMQLARRDEGVQAMPEIEQRLAQSIGEFLSQYYPLNSQDRPTEFLAGAWENQDFHREASIKVLFELLKSEPTLILESELIGESVNLRIAYWGLGQKTYCYQTIISGLNYREILDASAKSRALKWKETANRLLACGESLEEVKKLGGDNVFNLEMLEKEEKWKRYGIDTSELALDYRVSNKDIEALAQLLITCHCLVAGWIADAHHVVHYDVPPLLPELLPSLLEETSDPQLVQALMRSTIAGYKDIFNALEIERPLWVPELALKLAKSLACLPDQSWAKEQVNYSLRAWLKQHQATQVDDSNCLETIQSALTIEDQNYLENLRDCLTLLKDDRGIAQVNGLLGEIEGLKSQSQLESLSLVPEQSNIVQVSSSLNGSQHLRSKPLLERVSLIHTLTGHSGKAASIAVSFDGRTIASGADDNTIKLWQLGTGELIHTLTGDSGRVLTIALSPDGQTLASSHKTSDRSCIQIWHLGTGELVRTLTGHHKWIYCLAFSPDGKTLISGGHKIKIWDLNTGEQLRTLAGHKKWVYSLAISPNGQTLATSGGDKTIKIWHLHTGELLRTLTEHSDWVRTVAISPDGKIIVSGSDDNTIKLWHVESGKRIRTLTGHSDWVLSLAISPNGQTLISGSRDNTIKLWDLESGKLLRTLTGHKKWVYSLAISPDGQTLASGSEDKTIMIWQAR